MNRATLNERRREPQAHGDDGEDYAPLPKVKRRIQCLQPMKAMCATCPFRAGSPYANLAPMLAESAMTQASRICHSTGSGNAINHRTGKKPMACRGARDVQLKMFAGMGFLKEPTDEAWAAKLAEIKTRK